MRSSTLRTPQRDRLAKFRHRHIRKAGASQILAQGLRSHHLWGVWSIHPDGTKWGPLFSAFEIGNGTADSTHFQTQLSDESIVAESYYNLNNSGFGSLYKIPIHARGYAPFGPGYKSDPRNAPLRHGRHDDGRGIYISFPFSPDGIEALTPFVRKGDWPSLPAVLGKKDAPRLGLYTHPAAAPDNNLLVVWSAGSINNDTRYTPGFDAGIWLAPFLARPESQLMQSRPEWFLRTARGERLMHPDFGCGIHDLAFDVVDVSLLTRIESGVRDALLRYEARIEVLGVRADPLHAPDGVLLIELDYRVRRTNQIGNLVYPFYFREGGVATTNRGSRG